MKKQTHSKLKLNRESIRILDGDALSRAAGGMIKQTGPSACEGDCVPPSGDTGCHPVLFTDLC
jgi:hypothetical protein